MKNVRVGILGCGKVIQGLFEVLMDKMDFLRARYRQDIRIIGVADSTEYLVSKDGYDPGELLSMKLEKNASGQRMGGVYDYDPPALVDAFLQAEVNVVVEALPPCMPTGEPALGYLLAFLSRHVPAVTTNKSPLVYGYAQLLSMSRKRLAPIKFSGAAGAALPTIDTISTALAGADLVGFEGVLNGTTNFLLTEMVNNKTSLQEELEIAKEMKICEVDPAFDLDGWDTAFKTLILAKVFMDPAAELKDVEVQGLAGLTYQHVESILQQGKTLKLLGKANFEDNQIRMRVKPSIISPEHPFFHLEGTAKAITLYTDTMGKLTLIGGNTGSREIAATIIKDLLNIHRDLNFV